MKVARIALMVATVTAQGCSLNRFESIDTCEFEQRKFLTAIWWSSMNCQGKKDDQTHLHDSVDETREMLDDGEEDDEPDINIDDEGE
jgi:hypothetical protein